VASKPDTLTLWELPLYASATLEGFAGSLSERYRGRLQEFGFHAGERISCLQRPGFGAPRVFRVSNATYSLDRELAGQVLVKLIQGDARA
jgi:Fe2+ transport system protein FeoA